MSLHPNDIQRRGRLAAWLATLSMLLLASGFFRAQVLDGARYQLSSEKNRLREVPIPAARGIIYDRHGDIIAENVPGYSVSILGVSADSLRSTLQRLSTIIGLAPADVESAVRRLRRDPNRPTVVLADASFDQVSVLEEHRTEFPSLIIQAAPKRRYPDGAAVSAFVGYTSEINETELNSTDFATTVRESSSSLNRADWPPFIKPIRLMPLIIVPECCLSPLNFNKSGCCKPVGSLLMLVT